MLETWSELTFMDFTQLTAFQGTQARYSLPFVLTHLEQVDTFLLTNNKIAYKIENVSQEYDTSSNIIIKNESGIDIGVLLFLINKEADLALITEYEYVALLIDCDNETHLSNPTYIFKSNYVVIDEQHFLEYEYEFKTSAPVWGKYNHKYTGINITPPTPRVVTSIFAQKLEGFNHAYYYESAIRGIQQASAFERYLKYYHLLELNFDYDVVRRIQSLDINLQSQDIGKLLRDYEAKEFTRLEYLFNTYCVQVNPILTKLNLVSGFPGIAEDMFFVFGKKESNPFSDGNTKYISISTAAGGFSFANYNTHINRGGTADQYRKFIGKVVMYIIYRIRNSIAHNKIGEYLLTSANQDFVTDFGEPLLLEVIKQVFKN